MGVLTRYYHMKSHYPFTNIEISIFKGHWKSLHKCWERRLAVSRKDKTLPQTESAVHVLEYSDNFEVLWEMIVERRTQDAEFGCAEEPCCSHPNKEYPVLTIPLFIEGAWKTVSLGIHRYQNARRKITILLMKEALFLPQLLIEKFSKI